MNKKSKVYILLCLCLSVIISALVVGGCQLAKNAGGQRNEDDKFVGVYITFSPIYNVEMNAELWEEELYTKVYAIKREVTENDSEVRSEEYIFENIDGIPYFTVYMSSENSEGYHSLMMNNCIFESKHNVDIRNGIRYESMEGSVYLDNEQKVYPNPVYQEKDGKVYMLPADPAISVSGLGVIGSSILEEDNKNGGVSIDVYFKIMSEPESISIMAMGNDDNVISLCEYKPYEIKDKLEMPEGTEYLIVKTNFKGDDEPDIKVYKKDDSCFDVIQKGKGVAFESKTVIIEWE